uniref:Peptidase C1A papain C-terminal domain-containing protein n=1 Tax=Zooxanthella nutricula TaxID=1333877 RepID=A0A7S2L5K1_9DINO|mmetsp:Transcript_56352/g.171617  ORF Transcript_56352/g.171617 Transcript_56352/m.171617 type:complete len:471 (+) Transcript_56352:55-1467(+)
MARLAPLFAAAASLGVVLATPPLPAAPAEGADGQEGECLSGADEGCMLQVAAKATTVKQWAASEEPSLDFEKNLKQHLAEAMSSRGFAPGVKELFDQVMERSGAPKELTPAELKAYKSRFESALRVGDENFQERAEKAIVGAMPTMPEALAERINSAGLPYKVKPEPKEVSHPDFSKGFLPLGASELGAMPRTATRDLPPSSFDTMEKWPACKTVIGRIYNQGHCGSCWAFAASQVMNSRICITDSKYNGMNFSLSRGYVTSCVAPVEAALDGMQNWNGCNGGMPKWAYSYVDSYPGVPPTDCDPYFGEGAGSEHFQESKLAPPCPDACVAGYPYEMSKVMFDPIGMGSNAMQLPGAGIEYSTSGKVFDQSKAAMQEAIMNGGPVDYAFYSGRAMQAYVSGVLNSACGKQANHAVTAIGWGVTGTQEYVVTVNSWGVEWGDHGMFKADWCVIWSWTNPGEITKPVYPTTY